ncbi:hypothetical protein ACFWVC_01430 [Streptomyces sp. NPDC058691]|uniref:hypothetical protein n=1 Tax=Streptomyces sp. NPDC058691 TaxID=3346601 RepID=UPI00366541DF
MEKPARETVAEVLAEVTPEDPAAVDARLPTAGERVASAYAGTERQVIGVLTVPNWWNADAIHVVGPGR